ncbi:CKLF-like MARVEL transmembrane domain-containing protein 2 [Cricetulus griseus]|uniref:CKLF-like MARVEL transmembrane domain-containing protein 2 n=1 Tax=Cricetulus griseus TaxID=10029 RepID=UPI0015C3C306|nr:CKLF-like MARVEL transmembrane domain-containing protein 2 [Cricetulus griseus]
MGEPPPAKEDDQKPHEDVGTRQGFRRYKWEFKDSNREFWKNGHAVVKIMTLICIIVGLQLFETVTTHPILILLLTMEVSFLAFFIFLYSFAINRYMPFVYWPITVSKDCRKGSASHIQAPGKRQPRLHWYSGWEAGLEKGSQAENAPPKPNCVGSKKEGPRLS